MRGCQIFKFVLKLEYMRKEIYKLTGFDSINAIDKEKIIVFTTYPIQSITEPTHFHVFYNFFTTALSSKLVLISQPHEY